MVGGLHGYAAEGKVESGAPPPHDPAIFFERKYDSGHMWDDIRGSAGHTPKRYPSCRMPLTSATSRSIIESVMRSDEICSLHWGGLDTRTQVFLAMVGYCGGAEGGGPRRATNDFVLSNSPSAHRRRAGSACPSQHSNSHGQAAWRGLLVRRFESDAMHSGRVYGAEVLRARVPVSIPARCTVAGGRSMRSRRTHG